MQVSWGRPWPRAAEPLPDCAGRLHKARNSCGLSHERGEKQRPRGGGPKQTSWRAQEGLGRPWEGRVLLERVGRMRESPGARLPPLLGELRSLPGLLERAASAETGVSEWSRVQPLREDDPHLAWAQSGGRLARRGIPGGREGQDSP